MSILNNSLLLGAPAAAGGYSISRSLRFNSSDSAYCSRVPGSASNQKTWTFSAWIKRTQSKSGFIFAAGNTNDPWNATATTYFGFGILSASLDTFDFYSNSTYLRVSSQVFRDYSSWGHLVVACDTTQATAANRLKVYWNGSEITTFATNNNLAQNTDTYVNGAHNHFIGGQATSVTGAYLAAYLADIHFIDGQALTPSSFGEFDATTGVWNPKAYSGGSYGTNGFHLPFSDNSAATATTLGKDVSGNGNNWTPNNLSVTAGAGNDSLVDSPTNGTASSGGDAGGTVVGNYCTWNPLKPPGGSTSFANGNLETTFALSGVFPVPMGTFGVSSGKWYWEITPTSGASGSGGVGVGIGNKDCGPTSAGAFGVTANGWGYYFNGNKYNNNSSLSYGASYTNNDVIGVALDCDNGTLVFYKNGVSQGTAYTGLTNGPYFPAVGNAGDTTTVVANFGARQFAYAAPAGFRSLNTANLPTPTILKGSDYFDTKLYTGNGSTQTISGLAFSGGGPDLVWCKTRSGAFTHNIFDSVRGVYKTLYSNITNAEDTWTDKLTAFNSDGFTLGADATGTGVCNVSGNSMVAWCWDAGTSTVTNTQGSITSQVRASASSGFSVVTWSASAGATVGHGLGIAPAFIIAKSRTSGSTDWAVYSSALGRSSYLLLNSTSAAGSLSNYWGTADPTSTVFGVYSSTGASNNAGDMVAYCFAPVSGYSSFGSYTGNGSTDGPFVYTGFRPKFLLVKDTTNSGNWRIYDSARDATNVAGAKLYPNSSSAENSVSGETASTNTVDFLSNGFKLRTSNSETNYSNDVYAWAAFAENPFSIARAR